MELRPLHALLAYGHMKSRWMDGASAETAVNCGLLWSHHQNQAARLKSLIRLRMKSDHLSYQSPCKTKTKPILSQRFKQMTQCPQHSPSRTMQRPSQLPIPGVPREPDAPMSGLKIMTYVEHLISD